MRAFIHDAGELGSPRWRRLCRALKASTPGDEWRCYGHLCGWWGCWAGQSALETGLWFDTGLAEVGRWAGADDAGLAWGRALLAAGYLARIEERYPAPLGRQGFVALDGSGAAMLDQAFACFRFRPDAAELALYISSPVKRARWAQRLGLQAAELEAQGRLPPGWIMGGAVDGRGTGDGRRETSGFNAETQRRGGEAGRGFNAETQRRGGEAAAGPRPVTGFARPEGGTGREPTPDVLSEVRAWKYQDPLRACLAMDASRVAETCWRRAVAKDRQAVMDELGSLVETDGRWAALRNPSSVLMAALRRRGLLG